MRIVRTLLACLFIVGAGAGATWAIFETEPDAERMDAVAESAMLVDVTGVERGDFRPIIRALGVVEPAREVILAPRVAGQVVAMSDAFVPGRVVRAGDVLFELEDDDYRHVLASRRAALDRALAELTLEEGRRDVARTDLALFDEHLSDDNRALVLREPQRQIVEADIEAARAAVRQAELDVDRTRIRAPFDALVMSRAADVGSQVGPGDELGRLVGIDTWWVTASVPQASLRWLSFPDEGETGTRATVRNRNGWPGDAARHGHLSRRLGELEADTRMARVVIDMDDPLALSSTDADAPALLIGAFVQVELEAELLSDVIRLPRSLLRTGDTVWTMSEGVLRIRPLDIVFRDAEYAYVRSGIDADARIVTTHLSTPVDGAPLRLPEGTGEGAPRE